MDFNLLRNIFIVLIAILSLLFEVVKLAAYFGLTEIPRSKRFVIVIYSALVNQSL